MNINKGLAKLLPEGLDDAVVTEISTLISNIVDDQVTAQVTILETKVKAFLRSRVDMIKEHAANELVLENEDYRNAKLFEDIKALVLLEAKVDDQENALGLVREGIDNVQKEHSEEVDVLLAKIEQMNESNESLEVVNKALRGKVKILANKVETISESIIAQKKPKVFKSSEKALVLGEDVDKIKTSNKKLVNDQLRTLISEESMKLMP